MSISDRDAGFTGLLLGIALVLSGCVPVLVRDDRLVPRRRGGPAVFKIPPGHYPPPGECRLWVPGRPPGHQPSPKPCGRIQAPVPPSARLIRRPARRANRVKVAFYHESQKGPRGRRGYLPDSRRRADRRSLGRERAGSQGPASEIGPDSRGLPVASSGGHGRLS